MSGRDRILESHDDHAGREAGEDGRSASGGQVSYSRRMDPLLEPSVAGAVTIIELPWPPSSLSGHNDGHWRSKSGIVAKHRKWAMQATLAARPSIPSEGDIPLHIHFHAPDNRSDRMNYWNRCKPYGDGIAEALGINDRHFLPSMSFGENIAGGKVVVLIGGKA